MAEAAPAADPPEGSAAAAVDPELDSQWALAAVGADGVVQLYWKAYNSVSALKERKNNAHTVPSSLIPTVSTWQPSKNKCEGI